MSFFRKKGKKNIPSETQSTAFERAFEKRLGRTPADYIMSKISGGSDLEAIRRLFEMMAAEVELRERCKSKGFNYYYEKALSQEILSPNVAENSFTNVTKSFAVSQLIGKERFLRQYDAQLKALADNRDFMRFVQELRHQLSGQEVSNTWAANRKIADYFYKKNANELFVEVKAIVEKVICYGKQASAHISIYYAMFIYE